MKHNLMLPITIIIPFFNAEQYIGKCIQSLLAQNYPQDCYEIIMINNNSTDHSPAIVQQYPHITLLEEKKQGSYAARNRGIREAKGDIIAFTDSDCIPHVNWLQYIAQGMQSPNTAIVLGSRQPIVNSLGLALLMTYENVKKEHVFNSDIKDYYFGHTNNMAVRRSLFNQLGLFSERARGADTIFVQHAVSQCSSDTVRYSEDIKVAHMEIDSVGTYFSKMFIHGRGAGAHKKIAQVRFPRFRDVLPLLQNTVRQSGNVLGRLVFLVSLLTVSRICWQLGKWSAVIAFEEISEGQLS